jgi:hypothetical protein
MKFGMDFSLIIAVLVLVQLYILNIKVNVSTKPRDKSEELLMEKNTKDENIVTDSGSAVESDLYFIVHRSNGEEKVYAKKEVA